jgi:NhaP-type Na+/H+ or K+/H+ antiporter
VAKWTSLFYSGLSEKEDGVMLISIAMMFLVGMSMGWICKKIHLPSLFGMIVTGIVLGPYVLDVIDASILNISSDLRRIALIIILMRAGLSLDLNDLKKVGRPAVLMCFVPACFEIGGMILLAPKLLGISILDAAIMGTVIAAVSPAVIVPKMLKLMEEGYGVKKSIPQMILAGASVDDVFVIVMFSAGRSSFGSGLYQYSDFDCSRSFSRISYRISLCRIF